MPQKSCRQNLRLAERILRLVFFGLGFVLVGAWPATSGQQAGGVQASGPRVKMVRSVAGTKGDTRGATFVMADPRTTFFVPEDHQVIVYFEWEAPRGTHHCEGTLHGPNGQLAVMSSFDYPATQPRFGGFWTIPLLANTSAGVWTFESRVDGESAGTLNFEIVSAKRPEDAVKEETPPTPAELYGRAVKASVLVDKLDDKGRRFDTASGFFLEGGFVVTSFQAIDGARELRIRLSDGGNLEPESIVGWNRRQDWALLNVAPGKRDSLRRTSSKAAAVGDHCYWLDTKPDGARVISDGQIVGKEAHEGWGERLSISGIFSSGAAGGPVLNEHGEVLGLLGGTIPEPHRYAGGSTFTITGSVVPIDLVSVTPSATLTTLQTLWATNQFTLPVTGGSFISFGMITQGKPQKGKVPFPKEMKVELSVKDGFASIVIAFQGIQPWKNTVQLQIYDVDNHLVSRGEPAKVSLRSGETQERTWSFPLAVHPGIYRADVLVGEEVAWREYFRISE